MNLHHDFAFFRQVKPIWHDMDDEIVLASSVRLLRNLNRFKFASKLDEQARAQVLKFISSALTNHPKLQSPTIISAEQMTGDDKEFLLERFLFLEGLNQASSGEAFAVTQNGRFLAILNLCEHLQLMQIAPGERIDKLLVELVSLETHLSGQLDFAYSNRFGFLTAEPSHCGTGLIANVLLHLPTLVQSGKIEEVTSALHEDNVIISGLDQQGFVADMVLLRNRHTIGISEEKIIANLQSIASRLSIAEMSQRKKLQHDTNHEIMDRVARAYGLVKHSYMLDTREAMQAISLLKLGSLMGWLQGLSTKSANQWLFDIQRAHLRGEQKEGASTSLNHERALLLHKMLTSCNLLI